MHKSAQHRLRLIARLALLSLAIAPVSARPVHSYINEQGVRTYFNVLQRHVDIAGVPMVAPEEDPAAAGPQPAAAVAPAVSPYDGFITGHAAAYGVDPDLVRAVIAVESGFNPLAVSHRGAVGLMQLIPSTARRFGVRNIFHPEQNIEGGIRYIRFLLDTFNNDLKLTLAAYNAGENIVRRLGGIPNYPETLAYIRRVTGRYGESYRLYPSPPAPLALIRPPAAGAIQRIVDSRGNIIYTNLQSLP